MTLTADKLNIAIAYLLGYHDINCTTPPWGPLPGQTRTTAVHPDTKATDYLPDWAGDVGAAWELVERMETHDRFELERMGIASPVPWFCRGSAGHLTVRVYAFTAPLAICCAFYEAVTGERVEVASE